MNKLITIGKLNVAKAIPQRFYSGFAIALAWPETWCKKADAWYDFPMQIMGICKNGYYKVGHSAVLLVEKQSGHCHYFDFGRYHSPKGKGRVRSKVSDHDLKVHTKAIIQNNQITNLEMILKELSLNESTHGQGDLFASLTEINFHKAMHQAERLQNKTFTDYGPFTLKGTNCSRFVQSVLLAGKPKFAHRLKLQFPYMITPTPIYLVMSLSQVALASKYVMPLNEEIEIQPYFNTKAS